MLNWHKSILWLADSATVLLVWNIWEISPVISGKKSLYKIVLLFGLTWIHITFQSFTDLLDELMNCTWYVEWYEQVCCLMTRTDSEYPCNTFKVKWKYNLNTMYFMNHSLAESVKCIPGFSLRLVCSGVEKKLINLLFCFLLLITNKLLWTKKFILLSNLDQKSF